MVTDYATDEFALCTSCHILDRTTGPTNCCNSLVRTSTVVDAKYCVAWYNPLVGLFVVCCKNWFADDGYSLLHRKDLHTLHHLPSDICC